jgi:glycosyltransferase involved in cell wall biosynthesis
MNNAPEVSVILPAKNAQAFIRKAIESILNQSFKDFELIIMNDGSTDKTKNIIKSYKDDRIVYLENKKSLGISACLNQMIKQAKAELIARMDTDDISHQDRLFRQIEFMKIHRDVDVCGTYFYLKTDKGKKKLIYPKSDADIKANLIFRNPLAHPSVIMRKKIFLKKENYYNEDFETTQDYELWCRLKNICNFSNLPQFLLTYRVHKGSVSKIRKQLQEQNTTKVQKKLLEELQLKPSESEFEIHRLLSRHKAPDDKSGFKKAQVWLIKLFNANHKLKIYNEFNFNKLLLLKFLGVLKNYKIKK